ncbi:hypothetical protein GCM10009574_002920 [Streptomyces asiaticus]|uniref:Uncharacterized protein n=2 Tax=Streptomyces rhizosphaericus TaxID=114699 RepID=A0ABN1P3Z8_9ACTN
MNDRHMDLEWYDPLVRGLSESFSDSLRWLAVTGQKQPGTLAESLRTDAYSDDHDVRGGGARRSRYS